MKIDRLVYALFALIIIAGCKENKFPDAPEEPEAQFRLNGMVANQSRELIAGENDYYMFTGYRYDTGLGKYIFEGELAQTFCDDCPQSIRIEIADSVLRQNGTSFDGELPLNIKSYDYAVNAVSSERVIQYQFQSSVDSSEARSYFWDFGDGTKSEAYNPKHLYTANQDRTVVTHEVIRKDSCITQVSKPVELDTVVTADRCRLDFDIQEGNDGEIILSAEVPDSGQRFVLWQVFAEGFNEPVFQEEGIEVSFFASDSFKVYKIIMITEDVECSGTVTKSFSSEAPNPAPNIFCDLSFIAGRQFTLSPQAPRRSSVVIRWIAQDGTEYRTDLFGQPSESYFNILSVDQYEDNENSQTTVRMEVEFRCEAFDALGQTILLDGMSGFLGVAYP